MDILAVYESAQHAVDYARSGGGPSLIEYKTFRMTGHSAHDDAGYVPPEMFEDWQKKDPIVRFEKQLREDSEITQERIDEMQVECVKIIDDAVDWAEQQPYPKAEDVTKDVYDEG